LNRKKEYRLFLDGMILSNAARVYLGKQFRIEDIDLGGKDARTLFMEESLGIKRTKKK
jgi:hypothetical protein